MHAVHYRSLASHLAAVPLSATVADLCDVCERYEANDADYWAGLVRELRQYPQGREMFQGVMRLCELLRRDNPRFVDAIFMDWVTEAL